MSNGGEGGDCVIMLKKKCYIDQQRPLESTISNTVRFLSFFLWQCHDTFSTIKYIQICPRCYDTIGVQENTSATTTTTTTSNNNNNNKGSQKIILKYYMN